MGAVHLGVVELKRELQGGSEESLVISAPDEERVMKNTAVHAHGPVDLRLHDGGGADDHVLREVVVPAALRRLPRQAQVIPVEAGKVRGEGHIAGADPAPAVFHDGVHRDGVIAQELPPHREGAELLHLTGSLPHAPAEEGVEPVIVPAGKAQEGRHVQGLEKGHHGVGRIHPEGVSLRPGAGRRVDDDGAHSSAPRAARSPDRMAGMARRIFSSSQSHQRRASSLSMTASSKRLRMGFAGTPPTMV